ncbi:hypothetical protein HJC23_004039 [Cyclotella cryptica]|uniref:Uncharacterized protein n=1 Tax=Cyclotella cryptica TaxID=29204 RepID=A0ABD3QTQ9_9STRA|eukprot:CCRYP_002030-RA/>CCRYP_002030-RA protein AED:0.23 eAED:0.23 QI:0/-1/0/1/-1/1/1/0/367
MATSTTRIARTILALILTLIIFHASVIETTLKSLTKGVGNDEDHDAPFITLSERPPSHDAMKPLPLAELVRSESATYTKCPPESAPILDRISPDENDGKRRIPRIIHITSKNRCATIEVLRNLRMWRFPGHSLYFHDDDAVERLTSHPLSQRMFPLLNETLRCVTNGATKSDLWRYLVLYTYGGIYTDIDNSPRKFNGNTIFPTDDSFFVIEQLGIMAQYFIASSPGHPLMRLSLETAMDSLRSIPNVMKNNPARTTGPNALKVGFVKFMNGTTDGYISAGTYVGIDGRSATVVGDKSTSKDYIVRTGLGDAQKFKYYKAMGIEHFHETNRLPQTGRISCMEHLKMTNGTNRIANYTFNGSHYVDLG